MKRQNTGFVTKLTEKQIPPFLLKKLFSNPDNPFLINPLGTGLKNEFSTNITLGYKKTCFTWTFWYSK